MEKYPLQKEVVFREQWQAARFADVIRTFCRVTVNDLKVIITDALSFSVWREIEETAKRIKASPGVIQHLPSLGSGALNSENPAGSR